jgi:hypothetical protein
MEELSICRPAGITMGVGAVYSTPPYVVITVGCGYGVGVEVAPALRGIINNIKNNSSFLMLKYS